MPTQVNTALRLSSPITAVSGVGPAKAKTLEKLNITHVRDLLYAFPGRYEDFSKITPIAELKPDQQITIRGKIKKTSSNWGFRGKQRLLRIVCDIEDDTGIITVTWYNLRFLTQQLVQNREIYVAGIARLDKHNKIVMHSPAFEFSDQNQDFTHTARITPIYPETHGVTSRWLRYQIKKLLPLLNTLPEYIPVEIIKRQRIISIQDAIKQIHFPDSQEILATAERRLRFDELFFLQLAALVRQAARKKRTAFSIKSSAKQLQQLSKKLPFKLTSAQKTALNEIIGDLKKTSPMNRLLQGDVGSGKSAVALLTTQLTLNAGYQVLYLAPTEILARQQYEHFKNFLPLPEGESPANAGGGGGSDLVKLLVGSQTQKQKQATKQLLQTSQPIVIIGTHALLQQDVSAKNVALAIVDEQHRFGVAQRSALQNIQPKYTPHLLSMTATPIPRTLSLTVYGDLDVSVLDELPPGRQPIKTKISVGLDKEKAIIHILEELHAGRQAFVIAPLVEQSDKLEAKSATEAYHEIKKLFPGIAVGLVHGQLPSEEKSGIMKSFSVGAIQVLVATAVVEVGVNVPNATIMIIEGAERFGLAQLHQFRGRIGRGSQKSYCYLFPTSATSDNPRLNILSKTTDGFKIAEEDLKLRGPGEVYGLSQSGFGNLKVASLLDYATIKSARTEAQKILTKDPALKNFPILQKKVEQKNLHTHFE